MTIVMGVDQIHGGKPGLGAFQGETQSATGIASPYCAARFAVNSTF
jgi:hypothetical protein